MNTAFCYCCCLLLLFLICNPVQTETRSSETIRKLVELRQSNSQDEKIFTFGLSQKLPTAIIIGAKKSGTRALLKFIGAHRNVSAAGAETHFFDRFYHLGVDWYRRQMPLSDEHQTTIEKTPKYFVDERVPQRVYALNPRMKLIVVLRDPVTRAVSEYVQGQLNRGRRLFDNASRNESDRFKQLLYDKEQLIRTRWPVVRNGLYYKHLLKWLEYFPIDQFLFVNGEQLIREPSVELAKVQEFLNLTPQIQRKHFVLSKRKGFACIYTPLESRQIKCLSDQKGRMHPTIDDNVLNELREFYRPYNEMLFKLINQEPWWPI